MLIDFDVNKYDGKTPIIIWGTGVIGKILCHGLEKRNITISAFADSFKQDDFFGKKIITPENLVKWYRKEKIIILIGVTGKRREIVDILKDLEIDRFYDAWNLIECIAEESEELQKADFATWQIRESYLRYKWEVHNPEKLWVRSVDFMITERCSLKCRDCSNLMQYYKHPVNCDLEVVRQSFNRFLDRVDRIGELRVIGGEPLMHPEFYKVLQWYEDCDKIGRIGIWSNGTIFPPKEITELLKAKKLWMRFSDYGELSYHLSDWVKYCEEKNINYEVNHMDEWHNLGELKKRNYSKAILRDVYRCCECNNLPTFLKGKLYNCPYAANADNLHGMKQEDAVLDSIDFSGEKVEITTAELKNFLEKREYLMACDYCSGRNNNEGGIEPYIQVKKPLEYVSYEYK